MRRRLRFGVTNVVFPVQIKNDRFGRRGTTARVLMRPATSLDILVERPSSWPAPPPGFSTKHILGPGSDYNTVNEDYVDDEDSNQNDGRSKKRRKGSSERDRSSNASAGDTMGGQTSHNKKGTTGKRRQRAEDSVSSQPSAADRLNQGLSSGRSGFTMEEMEAMRAAKKNASSK
jgi:hypothetical protein